MTNRATIASVVAAITVALAGCAPTDGPAGFCGWMGADVEGLDQIVNEDGTTTVGTWYHVFAEGIATANEATRVTIAHTIADDREGYDRLVRHAENPSVEPALERLYQLLQNPEAAANSRTDPEVQQDIATIDAQGCDFLRQAS